MSSFAELLTAYAQRTGATDEDLALAAGVRPVTVARWRAGQVKRPRSQAAVEGLAASLALTPAERAELLASAGLAVEGETEPETAVGGFAEGPANFGATKETSTPDGPGLERAAANAPLDGDASPEDAALFEKTLTHDPLADAAAADATPAASGARKSLLPRWDRGLLALIPALLLALLAGWWLRQLPTARESAEAVNVMAAATPGSLTALPDEQLLLVAKFADLSAARAQIFVEAVQAALDEEIAQAALDNTRVALWPGTVDDAAAADRALAETGAVAIIWGGAWDDAGANAAVAAAGNSAQNGAQVRADITLAEVVSVDGLANPGWVALLSSPDDLAVIVHPAWPQGPRLVALTALGRLYRGAGAPELAQAAFTRALALQPASQTTEAMLHFLLATVAEQRDDPAGAIAEYGRVIPLRPDWVNPRYNRGRAYLQRYFAGGEPDLLDAAIAELSWTADAVPALGESYLARGVAYYERNRPGDLALAAADMRAALARAPNSAEALYHRGLLNIRRNDPQWRIDLERALALDPDNAALYAALCRGYALEDKAARAATFCYRARELDAAYAATDVQGIVYAKLGRTDEAIAAFEAYLDKLRSLPRASYVRQNGAQVEGWLDELRAGDMPFDTRTLADLR